MKKRILTAVAMAVVLAFSIVVPVVARQSHAHDGCCNIALTESMERTHSYDTLDAALSRAMAYDLLDFNEFRREIKEIIDLDNGYTVFVFEPFGVCQTDFEAVIKAEGIELAGLGFEPASLPGGNICLHGNRSIVVQEFHVIRTTPFPRTCVQVNIVVNQTCPNCWWTSTSTGTRSG